MEGLFLYHRGRLKVRAHFISLYLSYVNALDTHRLVILMPVYNDWEACQMVLRDLDAVLATAGRSAQVVLVDDGSTRPVPAEFGKATYRTIKEVGVLRLKRNLGHQRAICIGLTHVKQEVACDMVVVMDSDGEDAPMDVPRLLEQYTAEGGTSFIFAARTRRSERVLFRVFYNLYRLIHRVLVGLDIKMGNFSVVPASRLPALTVVPELWNHYAAAVVASRQPFSLLPTHRARRVGGQSSMKFSELVAHGLSAVSVFSNVVGVRLLIGVSVLMVLVLAGAAALFAARGTTLLTAPGWEALLIGVLLVVLLQALTLGICFTAIILSSRQGASFLPERDAKYFVDRYERVSSQQVSPDAQ